MRVGILRGDLPGPVYVADLEPVAKANFSVDPVGQQRYLSRPTTAGVTAALANVPASIQSTSNITFGLTVNGSNNTLKLRAATTGAYTTVTIASATYANITTLLAAVNTALTTAALPIVAEQGTTNVRIRLKTTGAANTGVGAGIGLDTVGNGSNAAASLGFVTTGVSHTVPTAATVISALNPISGTLDVSTATQQTQISPAIAAADVTKVADSIAPRFIETEIAIQSFLAGNLGHLASSSFNPDSTRPPSGLGAAAAVAVVQDDGVTAFSSSTFGALPNISSATWSGGNLTISGTAIGDPERTSSVKVKVFNATTGVSLTLLQRAFVNAGGSVSSTSIVILATSFGTSGLAAGAKVQVQFGTFASNTVTSS